MRGTNNQSKEQPDGYFSRNSDLRRSTGQMKDKRVEQLRKPQLRNLNLNDININSTSHHQSDPNISDDSYPTSPSVHHLIKGFQTLIGNGNTKVTKAVTNTAYTDKTPTKTIDVVIGSTKTVKAITAIDVEPIHSTQNDSNYKTPGYIVESSLPDRNKRVSSKRKLSIRKKAKSSSADDTRYNIIQSLGMSAFEASDNRSIEKSFSFFDIQSLFFDIQNAASLKSLYEEGSQYTKKLSGASAASAANQNRKRLKSGELDPKTGRTLSRAESLVDEGDSKQNHLLLSCPYFRNEIAEPEESVDGNEQTAKYGRDISKLISMFNRNRSFENVLNSGTKYMRHQKTETSEIDILEDVPDDSEFFTWDEPNVNEKQIFSFEHIDRGAMYYKQFFNNKENYNLFGIDDKYGPMAISIVREVLPKMAVLGHNNEVNEKSNKKYQYRIIFRTCELYTLRMAIMENSIPSISRHGGSRPLPLKDIIEHCFPNIQYICLRHCAPGPKISELLMKLDQQQLSTTYKIGLLYCKVSQKTEEEMYNNEHGGSDFLEFCSIIADTVILKGFQGYRAQLDNKNDSTGQHSLYTVFHGREMMFHVSTKLPYTAHDRQQLLRKRHIGNDIVTVVFQESGSEPFTPQMMRSHFQHVFVVVRVEKPHTDHTKYEVAMSRSRDVPYFGPPIPPDKFDSNAAFREFLLTKLINAENSAHKSEKFTHMARRTRYEYLKDLANNHVSQQTLEVPSKFGFSFSSKKKEKTRPAVNPEIWLQGGLVWTVKFDFEHDGPGSSAFLSVSTKAIVFIEQSTQKELVSIPCKQVLGWRTTSHTLKLFYDNGKMAFFTLVDDDVNELPFVVNRLKAVTPGCETMDLTLRRNIDGQLGFHVFYEGLVAEVEPYGLAWQAGLRKGSRLLEISGHIVGNMSHERMILMLKRPGVVRIVVLPPAPDGQPRNYNAVRNLRRYSSMTSVYSMSVPNLAGGDSSSGMSSSKEYLVASSDSPNEKNTAITHRPRSQSMERIPSRKEHHNSTSDGSGDAAEKQKISSREKSSDESQTMLSAKSQERLITSRSASQLPSVNKNTSPTFLISKQEVTSPSTSFDIDLGEIERQLTDTRKSIDAKFFRSLANSSSPFFRPGKHSGFDLPDENEIISGDNNRPLSSFGTSSDFEHELAAVNSNFNCDVDYQNNHDNSVVNKKGFPKVEVEITVEDRSKGYVMKSSTKLPTNMYQNANGLHTKLEMDNETNSQIKTENVNGQNICPGKNNTLVRFPKEPFPHVNQNASIERILPLTNSSSANYNVIPRTVESLHGRDRNQDIVTMSQIRSMSNVSSITSTSIDDQGSFSDSSLHDALSISQETLTSEKDSDPQRGSLVRTKVRDASEIINERSINKDYKIKVHETVHNTPSLDNTHEQNNIGAKKTFFSDKDCNRKVSPTRRLNMRDTALIKAVENAAKQKVNGKEISVSEPALKVVPSINQPIKRYKSENHATDIQQVGNLPENTAKFDESLNETFAKLDAAFGFRQSNGDPRYSHEGPRDEKRKKKRNSRRRSRNFEPPSSDSSEDIDLDSKRRINRNVRRQHLDDDLSNKGPKSEAEESLEAAISDFKISLTDMQDERKDSVTNSTIQNRNLSKNNKPHSLTLFKIGSDHSVHNSSSSNQPKLSHKLKYVKTIPVSSVQVSNINRPVSDVIISNNTKNTEINCTENIDTSKTRGRSRSEAKITMSYKPCTSHMSPTVKIENISENIIYQPSKNGSTITNSIQTGIETEDITIIESVILEGEVMPPVFVPQSPTRCGIQTLPSQHRRRRRATVSGPIGKTNGASCIPLLIRGLDLAAASNLSSTGLWSKEDLHVMLTVMENELEQEREEKERLSQELDRSREEKERLLEQSKQAESQLRKFTSYFRDVTAPESLQKTPTGETYDDVR